ncbi:MAG: HAMP domain-containing sensor histidine kinase, partial [Pseudomonadota bacterium]
MRPGKLYIKIFLSFFAVFLITLIVVFALFLAIPGKQFGSRVEEYTRAKALILKSVVEDKVRSVADANLSENEQLRKFIVYFGEILGAKVWLQDAEGNLPVKSFPGEVPAFVEKLKKREARDFGGLKLYNQRHMDFYAVVPLAFPEGRKGSLHILFDKFKPTHPERGFALGLAVIGLVIALLIFPISRLITRPLKELSRSALEIADGDLSRRAEVGCKDEIGELCSSFNHMADRVEKMIKGGRELTANISHELRSPLARMRIAEELLREKLSRGEFGNLKRHLNDIQEDICELDHLIGRILDLSKLDIHESPLKVESVDLSEFLNAFLERLKPAMEKKNLRLLTELGSVPSISGDREALFMALSNVLDNAVKFSPEKGEMAVKLASDDKALTIEVTNTCEALT